MSIRIRLILTISACLILAFGAISLLVFSSAKEAADESFLTLARSQTERVEEWINTFLSPGEMSVRYLASLPLVRGSRGKLTSYLDTKGTTTLLYANHPPHERFIYDEFIRVSRSNENYGLVFMANDDGEYAQAPEGHIKNAGYDPRQRSWYKEAMQSAREVTVTTPYLTTGGDMVCSILVRTRDLQDRPLGLLGVDYSLDSLTSDLAERRILKTGYLVVFDQNGRIIVDGHHPEYLPMPPEDYPALRKRMAAAPNGVMYGVGTHGLDEYIVIRAMDNIGWKIAVVFDQSEMMQSSYDLLFSILLITGVMFAATLLALSMLARSIVRPLEKLVDAAMVISSGAYEHSEEVRARLWDDLAVDGQGESGKLAEALKMMIDTLHERIEAANVASSAKSAFLSNMSHEMRTPMNAVIGMTSIARNSSDIEKKDYCLDKISEASNHLLGVINDILDMSKIEANKFELSFTGFDFERMLRKVSDVIAFRVDEKRQNYTVHIDQRIPRFLNGDEQRLAQVITNLLGNAVKFTPEGGGVRLNAFQAGEEDGVHTIQVEVSDTGIGISEEQQSRLFSSFEQADSSIARKFGGTGLGLAISKRIIEMMGGRIWIVSEPDKGSTFAFTIRAEVGKEGKQPPPAAWVDKKSLRVLVVDDDAGIREYFREILQAHGIFCDTAGSGDEAWVKIRNDGPYGICFVDWKMPGMDGMELARDIKADNGNNAAVVMISAADWGMMKGDAEHVGVDAFLPKPLFPSDISDCINRCLGVARMVADQERQSGETECFLGCRILLAEDVEINREIVLSLLEPTKLAIDCAENGEEAVRMFEAAPEAYDMIFMDVQMPEMDGYEATRRIRALEIPKAKSVPIVAMTANVFREDIEKGAEAGMNDHVGKPLDLDNVLLKLRTYLPRGRLDGESTS
ncbi:MAG: response regulator [Desulfovibrionaceae bacterium]|nr:response regulator [Desulfovibrionaceae bacterium]